jgi:hypothetical protein
MNECDICGEKLSKQEQKIYDRISDFSDADICYCSIAKEICHLKQELRRRKKEIKRRREVSFEYSKKIIKYGKLISAIKEKMCFNKHSYGCKFKNCHTISKIIDQFTDTGEKE